MIILGWVWGTEWRRQKNTDGQRTGLPELMKNNVCGSVCWKIIYKDKKNILAKKLSVNTFYNCTDQHVDSFPHSLILWKRKKKIQSVAMYVYRRLRKTWRALKSSYCRFWGQRIILGSTMSTFHSLSIMCSRVLHSPFVKNGNSLAKTVI